MRKIRLVRQLRNGQITIPKEFREELGLKPDDFLEMELRDGRLYCRRIAATPAGQGSDWLAELRDAFAGVRENLKGRSEEEINAAIDEALTAHRAEQREQGKRAAG